jgi:hypothetical protein
LEGLVTIESGKTYTLNPQNMANVLAEWDTGLSAPQRLAMRELAQSGNVSAQAIHDIVTGPKYLIGPPKPGAVTEPAPAEGVGKAKSTVVSEGKVGGGGGGGAGEGGGGGIGEGEGKLGGGGSGGGLFRKAALAVGLYFTAKNLKRTWGTDEFGITVAREAMIWGSAFSPLGPFGPPLVMLAFMFGDAFGESIATLINALPRGLEALSEFAEDTSAIVSDVAFGHTLALRESLNPDNWDLSLLPEPLISPADRLGVAIWSKVEPLKLQEFRDRTRQPLNQLGIPLDAAAPFAKQWSLLQSKQTGTEVMVGADQILAMTPEQFINFLKEDKLRFLQDPGLFSRQSFYDNPTVLDKGETTRLHDLVAMRAMINPYNWDLSQLPNVDTRQQDAAVLRNMGIAVWKQLVPLEQDEFRKMSAMSLSTFGFSGADADAIAGALARMSFPFFEMSPEMIDQFKEMFLKMTPQDLSRFMRETLKLGFKQDPAHVADEAVEEVKRGYQPWHR